MDADSLARAAGSALVSAMTTDTWRQACTAVEGLYERLPPGPDRPDPAWLSDLHRRTQAMVLFGDLVAEQRLREACAEQLLRLLRAAPRLAGDLQRVLEDVILPALGGEDQRRVEAILREPPGPAEPPRIVRGRAPRDPPIFRSTDFRQRETQADPVPPAAPAPAPPPAPPAPPPAAQAPPPAPPAPPPAAPSPAPQQERPQLISTGFTAPDQQAGAISQQNTLVAGMPYLYWFEIGDQLARGAIDEPGHRALPLDHPPAGTPLTVAVFGFPGEFEISPGEDVGELVVADDGSVRVSRQPLRRLQGEPPAGRRLLFPVRAPDRPGRHHLRASLYCRQTLLQSRLIEAEVTARPEERTTRALRSSVDYAVSSSLDPARLASIRPLRLSMLLNDNGDGTHGFRFLGEQDLKGDVSIDAMRLQDLAERARRTYRHAGWDSNEEWTPGSVYVYRDPPGPQRLGEDLISMARAGYRLWSNLALQLSLAARLDQRYPDQAPARTLQEIMRKPGFVEVATKFSARMVVPAAIFYDYPLDSVAQLTVCPAAMAAISRHEDLAQHRCFLGDCPSYADDTVVCPGGFWGFRHGIGLPQSRDETGDRATDETDDWAEIRCETRPEFVIGIAQEFAGDHVTRVRDLGDARSEVISDRDQLLARLREKDFGAHLVYFFCHGALVNGIPALTVGQSDAPAAITPDNIQGGTMFWRKTHPLVILNGCSTAALEPRLALDLVDAFVRDACASGVIGTEVTIFPPLATAFADEFFARFLDHDEPIGEAVRRSRLRLLSGGNPLGLVYIVYAAPRLLLVP
jgi:hypothetical protein